MNKTCQMFIYKYFQHTKYPKTTLKTLTPKVQLSLKLFSIKIKKRFYFSLQGADTYITDVDVRRHLFFFKIYLCILVLCLHEH